MFEGRHYILLIFALLDPSISSAICNNLEYTRIYFALKRLQSLVVLAWLFLTKRFK